MFAIFATVAAASSTQAATHAPAPRTAPLAAPQARECSVLCKLTHRELGTGLTLSAARELARQSNGYVVQG
jgi:hypothetical protein